MAISHGGLISHLIEQHGLKPWSVLGTADDQHRALHRITYTGSRQGVRRKPDHEHAEGEWPSL